MRKLIDVVTATSQTPVIATEEHRLMALPFIRDRLGIAAKLYCVAALSAASRWRHWSLRRSIFAGVTERAANRLYRDGFAGSRSRHQSAGCCWSSIGRIVETRRPKSTACAWKPASAR